MKPTRPGRYRYIDLPGQAQETVEVIETAGTLYVRFPGEDGEEDADVQLSEVNGDFEPLN